MQLDRFEYLGMNKDPYLIIDKLIDEELIIDELMDEQRSVSQLRALIRTR